MKYRLIANLLNDNDKESDNYNSWVGGVVVEGESGNVLGYQVSPSLDLLERDLLNKVRFDKKKDSYTKNW